MLSRFIALRAGDRRLILQATLLLAAIRAGLVLMSLYHLRRSLAAVVAVLRHGTLHEKSDDLRVPWAVAAASRLWCPTCLVQALATQALLEMHGAGATICIGARRRSDGKFEAHASVHSSGRIVLGQPVAVYHALARFDRMRP